jgi:hypothetical protein
MRSFFKKSSAKMLVVAIIVCSAGTAMAATGVTSLASTGDGSNATARQSQAPLGNVSATPPVGQTPGNGAFGVSPTESQGSQPNSANSTPSGTVKHVTSAGAAPGGSSSSGSSLPFTGFLAIPILLVGVALLGAGLVARRRTTGGAEAAA